MEQQTVIRGAAKPGAGKPNGAVSSVFDVAAPAKTSKRQVVRVDPTALKIERGVPMPEARSSLESPWPGVYAQMKKGDMVRLTERQAISFVSWGKKANAALARRNLGPDSAGVWRTA